MAMYQDLHREFALRTRVNLEFIEAAEEESFNRVYPVTQLMNSLLGMIVFLKEGQLLPEVSIEEIAPSIDFEVITDAKGKNNSLKTFLTSFRNAIAHCHIEGYGEGSEIQGFVLRDCLHARSPFHWEIRIPVEDIRKLAFGLVDHVIRNSPPALEKSFYPSQIDDKIFPDRR